MTNGPQKVLVVDDDFRVAAIHAAYVERVPGFKVVGQAHTAARAVEAARVLEPDLILLDLYLPDGDGLSLARRFLAQREPPAIIVISAARDIASVRSAIAVGAVHYLIKPFGFEALASRLESLRRRRMRIDALPAETSQQDIDALFGLSSSERLGPDRGGTAPTLALVYRTVAEHPGSISASEVAEAVGISRTTAQRYLTQLLDDQMVKLELRYGSTGRPEHRYSAARRNDQQSSAPEASAHYVVAQHESRHP